MAGLPTSSSSYDSAPESSSLADQELTQSQTVTDEPEASGSVAKKKPRYSCTFRPSSKFPWAICSDKGDSYALCKICRRDMSVAYGGFRDLIKHENTALHKSRSGDVSTSASISSFINKAYGPKRDLSVVTAEVKFSYFIGEHHLPISIADHCAKLFPQIFPDSAIARSFKCGRTKTTSVIKVRCDL